MEGIIQVAGVIDKQEASLLAGEGVKFLGFPLRLPVNAVDHTEEEALEIISTLEKDVQAVLITYQNNADDIIKFCDEMKCTWIQLHGDIELDELKSLKAQRPDLTVIKSLVIGKVTTENLLREMHCLSQYVDCFITDTYDSDTGASGATGKTHSWDISASIVKKSPVPVILAGGLNPENVKEAIFKVKPAGVDVHTGIEDNTGRKSLFKVKRFIEEANAGFALLNK